MLISPFHQVLKVDEQLLNKVFQGANEEVLEVVNAPGDRKQSEGGKRRKSTSTKSRPTSAISNHEPISREAALEFDAAAKSLNYHMASEAPYTPDFDADMPEVSRLSYDDESASDVRWWALDNDHTLTASEQLQTPYQPVINLTFDEENWDPQYYEETNDDDADVYAQDDQMSRLIGARSGMKYRPVASSSDLYDPEMYQESGLLRNSTEPRNSEIEPILLQNDIENLKIRRERRMSQLGLEPISPRASSPLGSIPASPEPLDPSNESSGVGRLSFKTTAVVPIEPARPPAARIFVVPDLNPTLSLKKQASRSKFNIEEELQEPPVIMIKQGRKTSLVPVETTRKLSLPQFSTGTTSTDEPVVFNTVCAHLGNCNCPNCR